MLLQITNTCKMGCRHCLEDSRPEPMFMDFDKENKDTLFWKALSFMKKCNADYVVISGGEPTEHPDFMDMAATIASNFMIVLICSNGMFVFDKEKTRQVKHLLETYPNIVMQVYTNRKYYPLYNDILSHRKDFGEISRRIELAVDSPIYMKTLGRAAVNEECIKESQAHPYTTSCITAASVFYQLDFMTAFRRLESTGHFCSPMIDWRGNIHLSESWLCPDIGNVGTFDRFNEIIRFKPCGKCGDYSKLMSSASPKYAAIKKIMGINA